MTTAALQEAATSVLVDTMIEVAAEVGVDLSNCSDAEWKACRVAAEERMYRKIGAKELHETHAERWLSHLVRQS